jgi:hypothetical protein
MEVLALLVGLVGTGTLKKLAVFFSYAIGCSSDGRTARLIATQRQRGGAGCGDDSRRGTGQSGIPAPVSQDQK